MKIYSIIVFCTAALLGGCEALSSRVNDRFSVVPPHTQVVAASRKVVYPAAQAAVRKVGLLLGRTSAANGSIDGYAPIRSGDATSDTRQTTIEIRLTESGDGQTQVAVLVWEHTEGNFPGGVSEQAFREHSLYDSYFAALQQVLLEKGMLKTDGKP